MPEISDFTDLQVTNPVHSVRTPRPEMTHLRHSSYDSGPTPTGRCVAGELADLYDSPTVVKTGDIDQRLARASGKYWWPRQMAESPTHDVEILPPD